MYRTRVLSETGESLSTIRLPRGVKVQVELPYKEAIILACLATDKLNCKLVVREAAVW